MKIRYVDARYGGSAHDSLIWRVSEARKVLRDKYAAGERNTWLLGNISENSHIFLTYLCIFNRRCWLSFGAIFNDTISRHY